MNDQSSKTVGKQHTMQPPESVLLGTSRTQAGNKNQTIHMSTCTWLIHGFLFCFQKDSHEVLNQETALANQKKAMNKSSSSLPIVH